MDDIEVAEVFVSRPDGDLMYLAYYKASGMGRFRTVKMMSFFEGGSRSYFEMWDTRQEATEYFDDMYAEFYGIAPLVERRRKGLSE